MSKKRSLIKRKVKRLKFIAKYHKLCRKSFRQGESHKDYKTKEGRRLIALGRKELKYKDTTYSGDIYYKLFREWGLMNIEADKKLTENLKNII
jgi:hypothetical protein